MQDFRKLLVWQEAQALAVEVYRLVGQLRDVGSLRSQLRRSVESIPSNIAEGARRRSSAEFAQFLQTAIGSASECESQLDLLRRLDAVPTAIIDKLISDVVRIRRKTIALRKRVMASAPPNNPEPHKRRTPN